MTASVEVAVHPEQQQMDVLLQGIRDRYGYDFTHYSRASLKRRLDRACEQAHADSYLTLLDRLRSDEKSFDLFLKTLSITVTEMFRDPPVYKALREKVIPILKTYPFIKIWHAGCATGEEVYSMAILLHEEGFLDHARLYATDFNKYSLETAQAGVYTARNTELNASNYQAAGGRAQLSDYYTSSYELVKFRSYLSEHITFSYHNLVTDGVFGEMNLICCRNVLIYFDRTLQDQALGKFTESLRHGGFLCLGNKETLNYTAVRQQYEVIDARQRLYRKVTPSHA